MCVPLWGVRLPVSLFGCSRSKPVPQELRGFAFPPALHTLFKFVRCRLYHCALWAGYGRLFVFWGEISPSARKDIGHAETVWRQSEMDWVFPRCFFAQTPKGFEDMKERWNDPCMENGNGDAALKLAGGLPARPGWTKEAAPSGSWSPPGGRTGR